MHLREIKILMIKIMLSPEF